MTTQAAFLWKCQPEAEAFIQSVLEQAMLANPDIAALENAVKQQSSSRLFDWLDHVIVGFSEEREKKILSCGFTPESVGHSYRVFHHPVAQLPRIVMRDHDDSIAGISVLAESIGDYLMVRGKTGWIEGSVYSDFRRCHISTHHGVLLQIVERRGSLAMEPVYREDSYAEKYRQSIEKWQARPREIDDEAHAMEQALGIAEEIIQDLGCDTAAWLVLEVERSFWQCRNRAGQLQKARQDSVGLGWANHDHHTFRSSRRFFSTLVRLFEMLGFHCRERFYAGAEAGWGAQVMENPRAKLVLFLDVDLSPEEISLDFAHHPLPPLPRLGTIGLWCALHGDSILQSGMHHLEAQFLFEELTQDLQGLGVAMMAPFSDFPYLKQAFTQGEMWKVKAERVQKLAEEGSITAQEAQKFMEQGALGSHLENLQRREGYKGFNQKNVSHIIRETDPRHGQAPA